VIGGAMILKLFKFFAFIFVLAFLALTAYAYIGPIFGAEFSAPQTEIRKPVILHAE
jgi:hypothetical protein